MANSLFKFDQVYTTWTTQRLSRHVLYWLGWTTFYASINSGYHDEGFQTWFMVEAAILPAKLLYVYTVIYLLLPFFLLRKRYAWFFVSAVIAAGLGAALIFVVDVSFIQPHILGRHLYGYFIHTKIVYKILDLIYISSFPVLIKLWQRQLQQEKKAQALSMEKLGAELELLRNQLQPHFLFNTLNNLYGMVLSQHPQAAEVVMRLSDMMSYMLYECNSEQIELEKEITQLKNYIELEKIRYGNRLEVSFEVGGQLSGEMIAPLLFIAFWENAFKHGPAQMEQPSWITGSLWIENGQLDFRLENSIPEQSAAPATSPNTRSGIGLNNVKKRLELLYPGRYKLNNKIDETYFVRLSINLRSS
ncbi:MAG: sensor histidine kinase [Bacteroidota bacterium]